MQEAIYEKYKALPNDLFECCISDRTANAIGLVIEKYIGANNERLEAFKELVVLAILKEFSLRRLYDNVKALFGFGEAEAKEVTLLILKEILFQSPSHFPGIEEEIKRLGGEVPQYAPAVAKSAEQFINREEEIARMQAAEEEKARQAVKDKPVWGGIKELLQQFPAVGEQIIGTQESIQVKNYPVPMKPMIRYWLEDYLQKNNYAQKSNLERIQYVCHDLNTRKMNTEERKQLMLVLKSADGELELPLLPARSRIDFALLESEE